MKKYLISRKVKDRVWFMIIMALSILYSCKTDPGFNDETIKLSFSTDTVYFDTVFTTVGSATSRFKVFNTGKSDITISKLNLGAGKNSFFRLNVDGTSGNEASDIEIEAEDSIFIFIEVTIDPNNTNNPMIVVDSVNFLTNGFYQSVKLVAWGQDAFFHNGEILPCDTIWKNDKPHVIINSVLIDSSCKLTIEAGARIYSHSQSRIFVNGSLIVNGTLDDPVTFEADRLESFYEDLPGQWDGIHLLLPSTDNLINYAIIKNGVVGIRVDSLANNGDYKLKISNTIIKNMESTGILGITATIDASNCLVFNCGDYSLQLEYGGLYNLKHCTFANYSSAVLNHKKSLLRLNNYLAVDGAIYGVADILAFFTNSIIYGNLNEEVKLDLDPTGSASDSILFTNCLIRTELTNLSTIDCIIDNGKSTFVSPFANADTTEWDLRDYHLNPNSGAVNGGKYINIDFDLDGSPRSTTTPSIGCYE